MKILWNNKLKIFLLIFIPILTLITLEMLARATFYSTPPNFSYGNGPGELAPQNTIWDIWPDRVYRVHVNSMGYRDLEEVDTDKLKILAVGDSFTFAPYVATMDTWTAWLENELDFAGIPAEVLNAGRASATLSDYLKYIKDRGLDIKPDLVILQYTSNDIPDYRECRASIRRPDKIAKDQATILTGWTITRLIRSLRTSINVSTGEPTASDGCEYRVTDLLYGEQSDLLQPQLDAYRRDLEEFIDVLAAKNIPFLMFAVPDWQQIHYSYPDDQQQFLSQIIQDKNYGEFIDLLPAFQEFPDIEGLYLLEKQPSNSEEPYIGNGHPSRYGYLFIARQIAHPVIEIMSSLME